MKKKIAFGFIVFTICLLIIISFTAFPKIKELKIKSAIEKANYCKIDSDCVDAGGKCPFGCYVYVNKNEVNNISKLLESFNSKCVYGCVSCPAATCENNKCKEVCE